MPAVRIVLAGRFARAGWRTGMRRSGISEQKRVPSRRSRGSHSCCPDMSSLGTQLVALPADRLDGSRARSADRARRSAGRSRGTGRGWSPTTSTRPAETGRPRSPRWRRSSRIRTPAWEAHDLTAHALRSLAAGERLSGRSRPRVGRRPDSTQLIYYEALCARRGRRISAIDTACAAAMQAVQRARAIPIGPTGSRGCASCRRRSTTRGKSECVISRGWPSDVERGHRPPRRRVRGRTHPRGRLRASRETSRRNCSRRPGFREREDEAQLILA